MAVYFPAECWERALNICRVTKSEEKNGFTRYTIEVNVFPFKWHVFRRYRQFVELHEKMVKCFSLDKNLLPPKKVFGNRTETFISERQKALELYLQKVIHQFSLLPEPISLFLDFHKYEVRGISSVLAEKFFFQGERIISQMKVYEFSPLHLHATSERLKLGEPTCYTNNPKQDIAHLVEFMTQLKHLKIRGSYEYFEDSNIVPNSLCYDLSLFKCLETLEFIKCNLEDNLILVEALRKKLKHLVVYESIKDLSNILLSGIIHWLPSDPFQNWPTWQCITYASFSHNCLKKIHVSIKLLPFVTHLDLSYNEIEVVENLETLSDLSVLVLSHNKIHSLDCLHTRLGNIHTLYLSSNKIKSLEGLSKLFSISKLHLEGNLISSLNEVSHLSNLPCLEILNLQSNPVTVNVDYRAQILLMFGSHASEIELDGLKATEKEIDTVSVLQALKQARGEESDSSQNTVSSSGISVNIKKDSYVTSNGKQITNNEERNTTAKQPLSGLSEASRFRQQVETLRKIGGNDWLRLLNKMHSVEDAENVLCEKCANGSEDSSDLQLHTASSLTRNIHQLPPEHIQALAISSEISYPECISLLDNTNEGFKHQFLTALIKGKAYYDDKNENIKQIHSSYLSLLPEAKVLWTVLLVSQECSVYEIPICAVIFSSEIILLKVRNFSKYISSESCCDISLFPDLSYLRSIAKTETISLTLGPCDAYIEFKVRNCENAEILTFIFNDIEATKLFIEYCNNYFSLSPICKIHPFMNDTILFENIHAGLPLSNLSFVNHIIFGQRVLVSKLLHKCHYGILHYVFVTLSHVVLIEERLHIPHVVGLDTTVQPQFHICAIVSVHTNIKHVYLKDYDEESSVSNDLPEQSGYRHDLLVENKHLEVLYRCGSWLLIEFESGVILYLKFFSLKQRNAFLDAFQCARSQK